MTTPQDALSHLAGDRSPTRARRTSLVCAAGVALAVMGGCSRVPAPEMTLESASIAERTADATLLRLSVLAENPGNEALELREVRYEVLMDGQEVFRGERRAEATIRAFGAQRLSLPVPAPADVPDSARVEVRGTLAYLPPGVFSRTLVDAGWPKPEVAFDGATGLGPPPFVPTPMPTPAPTPAPEPVPEPAAEGSTNP